MGMRGRLPRLERVKPRDLLVGLGIRATWAMVVLADGGHEEKNEGKMALAVTTARSLVGAVVYPIWRIFRPRYRTELVDYPIGAGKFKLEIR
jgi:hypothetical protein